ncbi:MAG: hypothetical protein U0790_12095 [Isosphaeraceae bacterium]
MVDPRALPDMDGDLPEQVDLRRGEHQVVPGCGGLDPLGQPVHPGPGEVPAGVPEPVFQDRAVAGADVVLDQGLDAPDALGVQAELGGEAVEQAVQPLGPRPERADPEGPLLPGLAGGTSSRTVARPRSRSGSRQEIISGTRTRSANAARGRGECTSASGSHSISRARDSSRASRSQRTARDSRSAGAAGRSSARRAWRSRSIAAQARRRCPAGRTPTRRRAAARAARRRGRAEPELGGAEGRRRPRGRQRAGGCTGASSPISRESRQGMPAR